MFPFISLRSFFSDSKCCEVKFFASFSIWKLLTNFQINTSAWFQLFSWFSIIKIFLAPRPPHWKKSQFNTHANLYILTSWEPSKHTCSNLTIETLEKRGQICSKLIIKTAKVAKLFSSFSIVDSQQVNICWINSFQLLLPRIINPF